MAVSALRLRRKVLSLSTFIFNHHRTPLCSSSPTLITHSSSQNPRLDFPNFPSQSRAFRSSNVSFARPRTSYNDDDKPIMENDILFEGCDYNHWLIVMDFPKDNKPSPEQMVETYVQTAAKVLGSVEEAKRKIYACSTTTYQGFQVEVSEEVSNKFEGLPGVVFVLPDSYIDPANKEYGGDKYINGTIIPRPPPVQYNRPGGRYGDRNRDRERGGYQQRSQTYDNQGSMQGSPRNFAAPQNPLPQHNYGAPRVNEISVSIPKNNFSGDQVPPYHGNYNQERGGNSYPQGRNVPPGQLNNNTTPRVAVSYQGAGMNYGQAAGGDQRHGVGGSQVQGAGGGYGQGAGGGNGQGAGGGYGQGAGGGYGQDAGGGYGQGAGGGYGQGAGGGYGQGAGGGYGQGADGGYRQGASGGVYRQGATGGGYGAAGEGYQQGAPGGGYRQGAPGRGYGAAGEGYQQGAPGGGYGAAGEGYQQGAPGGGYGSPTGGYGVPSGGYGQGTSGGVPGHDKSQGEQMNDVRQVQQ